MNARVMGIVNVTPDSFSDGGQFFSPDEAVRRVRNLVDEGADIIDLGGESTRPGSVPISWEEEWVRLEPVLNRLVEKPLAVPISIDTYHPETASHALAKGVRLINCVFADSVPAMIDLLVAHEGTELIAPAEALELIRADGRIKSDRYYLDPMIGFGTTREEDLLLIRDLPVLTAKGRVVVGVSRKRLVKKLTGEKVTGKNLGGNLALALWCARRGASVVRVHDVRETVQALRVESALEAALTASASS